MQITKLAVIGAGTMGASIVMALISNGLKVVLKDTDNIVLENGLKNIDKFLDKKIAKGLSPIKAQAMKNLVTAVTDYKEFADVDIVIEAVSESINIKQKVFQELDEWCNLDTLLLTNTSSLSITQIASFTRRSDKVCGLHFFNPAHIMKLVEIIPGLDTSSETIQSVTQLANLINKVSVKVEECPSFLVNRLLTRYMNEALWCLSDRIYTVEEIDKAAVEIAMPIGPLALRDMNGCDIGLSVASYNFKEYGQRFAYPDLLVKMVDNNLLGKKTDKGFYLYTKDSPKPLGVNENVYTLINQKPQEKLPSSNIPLSIRLMLPMINEAFLVIQEKICKLESIDLALKTGLGMKLGPLELANNIGLTTCLNYLEELANFYGERFRPAYYLRKLVYANKTKVI